MLLLLFIFTFSFEQLGRSALRKKNMGVRKFFVLCLRGAHLLQFFLVGLWSLLDEKLHVHP